MDNKFYEVVYVDKFVCRSESDDMAQWFRRHFGLDQRHLEMLGSGNPVILKKNILIDTAERLQRKIQALGGVCWIQQTPPAGEPHERRRMQRRRCAERRQTWRLDTMVADRRVNLGRRSSDWF